MLHEAELGTRSPIWDDGLPSRIVASRSTMTELFADAVETHPDAVAVDYLGATLTYAELDQLSRGVASWLIDEAGLLPGELVAIYLQSSPQFVIGALATWLAGGTVVPINPMYKQREIEEVLGTAAPAVVLTSQEGVGRVQAAAQAQRTVRRIVGTCELDLAGTHDPRVFGDLTRLPAVEGVTDLLEAARSHRERTTTLAVAKTDDIAFICFTSGTSGPPKGAMLRHASVVHTLAALQAWHHLDNGERIFGIAPLFHVTGLVVEFGLAIQLAAPLVLSYRFVPAVALETIRRTRPTFSVGPPTGYVALANVAGAVRDDFASLRTTLAGGAPLPAALVEDCRTRFGFVIENGYGLTETTGPCIMLPKRRTPPRDARTNSLSIGAPLPGTAVRIVTPDGSDAAPGEEGEIAVRGASLFAGYWNDRRETASAVRDGWLFTGDEGFLDEEGFAFIVDRRKDMIIASGFKIWPGEVEQVLYEHPAVQECAVVGATDGYRGETVQAYVSLRPGRDATAEELIAWCRERMAAYKYPRIVEILDELPKTSSGKVLRRDLRALAQQAPGGDVR